MEFITSVATAALRIKPKRLVLSFGSTALDLSCLRARLSGSRRGVVARVTRRDITCGLWVVSPPESGRATSSAADLPARWMTASEQSAIGERETGGSLVGVGSSFDLNRSDYEIQNQLLWQGRGKNDGALTRFCWIRAVVTIRAARPKKADGQNRTTQNDPFQGTRPRWKFSNSATASR